MTDMHFFAATHMLLKAVAKGWTESTIELQVRMGVEGPPEVVAMTLFPKLDEGNFTHRPNPEFLHFSTSTCFTEDGWLTQTAVARLEAMETPPVTG